MKLTKCGSSWSEEWQSLAPRVRLRRRRVRSFLMRSGEPVRSSAAPIGRGPSRSTPAWFDAASAGAAANVTSYRQTAQAIRAGVVVTASSRTFPARSTATVVGCLAVSSRSERGVRFARHGHDAAEETGRVHPITEALAPAVSGSIALRRAVPRATFDGLESGRGAAWRAIGRQSGWCCWRACWSR
jgi:hypothetical protein